MKAVLTITAVSLAMVCLMLCACDRRSSMDTVGQSAGFASVLEPAITVWAYPIPVE